MSFEFVSQDSVGNECPQEQAASSTMEASELNKCRGMDADEFRKRGKEMVDYIADYLENISTRRVCPEVEPGYLRDKLPKSPPMKAEQWDTIMEDVENAVMPGVTHWQHPRFHAYFPAGNAYPSILAEMLSAGLGVNGFSWAASPVCTELETVMLDWLGRMIGLPKKFLPYLDHTANGVGTADEYFEETEHFGGGVLQGSASECILVSMLAARSEVIRRMKAQQPFTEDGVILSRLVAYTSKLAHSCVEKSGMLAFVKMRQLETDDNYSMRGSTLAKAIQEDRNLGLIPFFVSATLGTTACVSFDNLQEIGKVCAKEGIWLHVDAAYAGSAFICEEFRYLMKGVEYASSFNMNPNKWMLVNFDCSAMWVKDTRILTAAMTVDPLYLQHKNANNAIDYRHWGIALSRRFRSLKLWFVIRSYGVEGLQKYIREHVRLAKKFERLVHEDDRFETLGHAIMGLVCFRLTGSNALNQKLLYNLNDSGEIHMVPSMLNSEYVIRFAVCAKNATDDDVETAWSIIRRHAVEVLKQMGNRRESRPEVLEKPPEKPLPAENKLPSEEEEGDVYISPPEEKVKDEARVRRESFVRMVSDPKVYFRRSTNVPRTRLLSGTSISGNRYLTRATSFLSLDDCSDDDEEQVPE